MKISKSMNLQVLNIFGAVSDGLKIIFRKLWRSILTQGHSLKQVWEKRNEYRLLDNKKSFWKNIETLPLTPTWRVNFCEKSEKSG